MSTIPTNKIAIDKMVLQKTKALFSFVKSKIPIIKNVGTPSSSSASKGSAHGGKNQQQTIVHEDDFQLNIENVCNSDILEEIEKVINCHMHQREVIISDQLLADIQFMMVRMADYIQFSLNEREQIQKTKETYEEMKKENQHLQSVIDGFNQSMIQYENSHRKEVLEMQAQYQKEIDALNKQIEILIQEKNLQKKYQDEQIVNLINTKEQVSYLQESNRSLQNTLDALNIDMVKLKAIHQGEVSATVHEKNFKGLMTSKNTKHRILSFLTLKQTLRMRLLNREYNLIITRDFQLQRLLINNISSNYNQKTRELYRKAHYFQQVAESIPDEVLKVSILKYLCQRNKVGDLMVPSLNSAQIIIDGHLFGSEGEANGSTSNLSTKSSVPQSPQSVPFNNSIQPQQQGEGIDLLSEFLAGNDTENNGNSNNSQQQTQQQQQVTQPAQEQVIQNNANGSNSKPAAENPPQEKQSKTQKTLSFMKKLFDKKDTGADNTQRGQQITQASRTTLEKTLQNEFVNEEIANKLISDMNANLQIDTKVLQLFREEKDVTMKQLKLEQDEIHQKVKNLTFKYSQDPKKINVFLENLENSFCNMYVFSKFLYQESKALYDLQSYLSYELIQNKLKLEDAQNKLEDNIASKQSLEQMKDYLSLKLKETEKKNLQNDTMFLKSNKLIQELKEDNQTLHQKIQQIEKNKTKSDNNLKILAKEVRNQLKKNKDITGKYDKLLGNMNYLKEALANFKILEE